MKASRTLSEGAARLNTRRSPVVSQPPTADHLNVPLLAASGEARGRPGGGDVIINGSPCLYGYQISADDLLRVNLDVRDIESCGLYLIERVDSHESDTPRWMGCRRFDVRLDGKIYVDWAGDGRWEPVPIDFSFRVVGRVNEIYRRVRQ